MFSTQSCVCSLGSTKIHLFFLNERWYKLWLKIAITCCSNTRFTWKIISALCIWHIKAGKVCFVATETWNRSSPSFLSVVTSPSSTVCAGIPWFEGTGVRLPGANTLDSISTDGRNSMKRWCFKIFSPTVFLSQSGQKHSRKFRGAFHSTKYSCLKFRVSNVTNGIGWTIIQCSKPRSVILVFSP